MIEKNSPAPNSHRLVIKREFDAPRDLVWRAWNEPEKLKQWLQLVEDMAVESAIIDLREGGKFRIQTKRPDGEFFTAAGTYLEVKVPERLVYTWDWEKDGSERDFGELEGAETQLTVEFHELGGRTEMVLTHEKFQTPERRDRHIVGWGIWLDSMAAFVEGK